MDFSLRFSLFILLTLYIAVRFSGTEKFLNCTTPNSHVECPINAICSTINESTKNFQCTCLPNYVWNPLWQQVISGNNANTTNNISASNNNIVSNQFNILDNATTTTTTTTNTTSLTTNTIATATEYCLSAEATNATQTANGKVYVRHPAKIEHLAFGILMVLFVAIAAISLLYLLKVLRPIKRSKAVYTQLRRRRENRERLEEYCDDISMIELNEKR